MTTEIIYQDTFYTYDIQTEIIVVKTNAILDPILCISDLQECAELNQNIFDTAITILKDYDDLQKVTLVLVGDLYGESYIKDGRRIEIRGKTGLVNYDYLTINNLPRLIVYGNHDLPNPEISTSRNRTLLLTHGTTLSGVDFIESKEFLNFKIETEMVLKSKPDIFVSHETPLLKGQFKGNASLTKLVKHAQPKIHIFGHCHLRPPITIEDNIIFINCDARFILILPYTFSP